ncbi:hypothetical protein PIB30_059234, partial [Stylosanthes scabra]|nr:hypothetical protein [Stylosanthes scabra]
WDWTTPNPRYHTTHTPIHTPIIGSSTTGNRTLDAAFKRQTCPPLEVRVFMARCDPGQVRTQ